MEGVQAYGVSETGVLYWMKRFGFEYLNRRIIYMKTTNEIHDMRTGGSPVDIFD